MSGIELGIMHTCMYFLSPPLSNIAGNTLKKGKRYIIRTRSSQGGELGEGELDGEGKYDGQSTQPLVSIKTVYMCCI